MTAGQIELREGVEAALVANKIARAVALGEGLPESDFDYAGVSQESRAEVHKLMRILKRATGKHFAVIVEIGEDLSKAKELLGHGNFLPWLQAEFRWSERTARNYMSLAAHFQGESANFADLDVSTGLALAAAPAEVKDPIMQRVEAGEIISKAEVEAAIHVVRPGQVQGRPPPARAVPPYTRIVAVGDEAAAQAPVMTGADFRRVGARQAADELLRSLSAIAAALARHQDIGEIVATSADAEQIGCARGLKLSAGSRRPWAGKNQTSQGSRVRLCPCAPRAFCRSLCVMRPPSRPSVSPLPSFVSRPDFIPRPVSFVDEMRAVWRWLTGRQPAPSLKERSASGRWSRRWPRRWPKRRRPRRRARCPPGGKRWAA